jgi:hypothetical protein
MMERLDARVEPEHDEGRERNKKRREGCPSRLSDSKAALAASGYFFVR